MLTGVSVHTHDLGHQGLQRPDRAALAACINRNGRGNNVLERAHRPAWEAFRHRGRAHHHHNNASWRADYPILPAACFFQRRNTMIISTRDLHAFRVRSARCRSHHSGAALTFHHKRRREDIR